MATTMKETIRFIGEHPVLFRVANARSADFLKMTIGDRPSASGNEVRPEYVVTLSDGYGAQLEDTPDESDPIVYSQTEQGLLFERADYRLAIHASRREAEIRFYDYFGLRTAMLNWYSNLLSHLRWGAIVHSCCAVDKGGAHLFVGYSGAGKSTVASLSRPRPLMADETSFIRIPEVGPIMVHDSPFRNDFKEPMDGGPVPLAGIYLLKQSPVIAKRRIAGGEAMFALFDKIVHWNNDAGETAQLIRMCRSLVERVPVYELEFQKNDRFWEVI